MIEIYDANNILRRSYEHSYGQTAMSLRERYEEQAFKTTPQIWVWDGKDHNTRRQDIYSPYKANRPPLAENVVAHSNLWKKILQHTPSSQITVEGWEADDVIGTLVEKFSLKGHRVKVHTNDMDYGQIAHLCELNGVNLKGVEPRWIPLYKAMVGDPSDNIAGIPFFGPKAWVALKPEHCTQIERAIDAQNLAGFVDMPFRPAVVTWLTEPENVYRLKNMLQVTRFMSVPLDEIEGGWTHGQLNRLHAYSILSEFFL